jgi:hypothetical protein
MSPEENEFINKLTKQARLTINTPCGRGKVYNFDIGLGLVTVEMMRNGKSMYLDFSLDEIIMQNCCSTDSDFELGYRL